MKLQGSVAVGAFFALVGLVVFLSFLLSYPFMLLWNGCLVPAIPGVAEIGWLQSWGIMVLARLATTRMSNKKE